MDLTAFGLPNQKLGVLRADLAHPHCGGNKLFKLTYHLEKAAQKGLDTVLSFGGPWSNHLYAVAAACQEVGLKSIGLVRGPEPDPASETLEFARACGMQVEVLSREDYALKDAEGYNTYLWEQYGGVYVIPEGGAGYLGVMGAADLGRFVSDEVKTVCLGMGTGTTGAGLVVGGGHFDVVGYPAVKGGDGLMGAVRQALYWSCGSDEVTDDLMERFRSEPRTTGRFGSWDAELVAFMRAFYAETGIALDHVYGGPGVKRVIDDLKAGKLAHPCMWIHTGGLQGLAGLERALGEAVYPTTESKHQP